ncbi:MAG: hypothetical protein WC564_01480 [Patescibacteria group bacterium]|jgi:hypothetical protein
MNVEPLKYLKMEDLILRQHPASIRAQTNKFGNHPVNREIFDGILRDFSKLKIDGELSNMDIDDFKKDLLANNPETVINFIEESIKLVLIHPFVHITLFEVLMSLLAQNKITRKKYSSLYDELIKKRGNDISQRYNIEKVKTLLSI